MINLPFTYDGSYLRDSKGHIILSLVGYDNMEYMLQACNNFPKAIELLRKVNNSFKDCYDEIEEFLNSLEK